MSKSNTLDNNKSKTKLEASKTVNKKISFKLQKKNLDLDTQPSTLLDKTEESSKPQAKEEKPTLENSEISGDSQMTSYAKRKLFGETESISKKPQIEKKIIHNVTSQLLGYDLVKSILVGININKNDISLDGENEMIVVGRAPVLGSSTKQMRHVIPHSFISNVITQNVKDAASVQGMIKALADFVVMLLPKLEGAAISAKQLKDSPYKKLVNKVEGLSTRSVVEQEEITFLISPKKAKNFISKELSPSKQTLVIEQYDLKNREFIKVAIDKLTKVIGSSDQNTQIILAETIAKFIYIIFNQRECTAYPTEGNTLSYEIRLYSTKQDAEKASSNYKVVTSLEVKEMLDNKVTISEKIRIVDDEGSRVTKVVKALQHLDGLLQIAESLCQNASDNILNAKLQEQIKGYNSQFNTPIKLTNELSENSKDFLDHFNRDLEDKGFAVANHVAKQLFRVFDYKALEKYVFVLKKNGTTAIYPNASSEELKYGCIEEGNEYREDKAYDASGYNNKVVFRHQEKITPPNLAKKIFEYVTVAVLAFRELAVKQTYQSIMQSFEKLIAREYQQNEKQTQELDTELNKLMSSYLGDNTTSGSKELSLGFNPSQSSCLSEVLGSASYDDLELIAN